MSSSDSIPFKILENPSSASFKTELERITPILTPNDADSFFDILLGHFSKKIQIPVGEAILISIRKLIRNEEIRYIFVDGEYIHRLPFSSQIFSDLVFNIIYDFVRLDPNVFDATLCSLFAQMFSFNPEKSLVILANYAQKINDTDDPWAMLDLLFYESKHFNNRKTGKQYLTLLTFLCSNYEDYAEGRGENCWKQICSMLTKNYIDVLQTGYDALRIIYKYYPNGSLPISAIKANLELDLVQPNIFAFLLSLPIDHPELKKPELINCLINCAETSEKAITVLLQLATNVKNAEAILKQKEWTKKQLPTLMDTLRLFLVIFQHDELRLQLISERRSFVAFLSKLVELGTSGVLTVITTILRRVDLDSEFVKVLDESGFLHAFIVSAKRADDDISMHSCLLLISTCAKIEYVPSYLEITVTIARLVKKDEFLTKIASYVAVELRKYRECAEIFTEYKLDDYFTENLDNPKIQKIAQRYFNTNIK
ncbi:hypothetical protein TRFO_40969 [Tritrichomonas foetus]|uniref:Uncharacterized protein n=1 Tax=Tritrichomonas foetus TaxID=1144522 RepID=A0A1J4IZD2_9EUKA|nr:hypothetical protein TRFO_40969 [Tritrichomonas foetus]|eukprot:OHS92712.1 hypothetical protein TRFO_40969 [Tritrichomonas foetus]